MVRVPPARRSGASARTSFRRGTGLHRGHRDLRACGRPTGRAATARCRASCPVLRPAAGPAGGRPPRAVRPQPGGCCGTGAAGPSSGRTRPSGGGPPSAGRAGRAPQTTGRAGPEPGVHLLHVPGEPGHRLGLRCVQNLLDRRRNPVGGRGGLRLQFSDADDPRGRLARGQRLVRHDAEVPGGVQQLPPGGEGGRREVPVRAAARQPSGARPHTPQQAGPWAAAGRAGRPVPVRRSPRGTSRSSGGRVPDSAGSATHRRAGARPLLVGAAATGPWRGRPRGPRTGTARGPGCRGRPCPGCRGMRSQGCCPGSGSARSGSSRCPGSTARARRVRP